MIYTEEQKNRFWSKVQKGDKKECWPWMGAKKPKGYGNVRINKAYLNAHRVAWEMTHFDIPEGYIVCHACDNPSCCNPDHLMLGTIAANSADMIAKGRANTFKNRPRGERHGRAKITQAIADKIRSEYLGGSFQKDIGKKYGIAQTSVSMIIRNERWVG